MTVVELVERERARQRVTWGEAHDDQHTITGWSHVLLLQVGKWARDVEIAWSAAMPFDGRGLNILQERLVKIAATAQAAWEAIERSRATDANPAPTATRPGGRGRRMRMRLVGDRRTLVCTLARKRITTSRAVVRRNEDG